jgi:hypothetical protein
VLDTPVRLGEMCDPGDYALSKSALSERALQILRHQTCLEGSLASKRWVPNMLCALALLSLPACGAAVLSSCPFSTANDDLCSPGPGDTLPRGCKCGSTEPLILHLHTQWARSRMCWCYRQWQAGVRFARYLDAVTPKIPIMLFHTGYSWHIQLGM